MAFHVYPTETPVGIFEVDPSNRIREYQWAQYEQFRAICSLSAFKLSGGALSVGAGLTADIAEGQWFIDGRYVRNGSIVNTGAMSDDHSHYIYFQLTYTGSLVTSVAEYDTTSATPPDNAVCVGIVNIFGGVVSVTSIVDGVSAGSAVVLSRPFYSSSYTGNGTNPRMILLGFQPSYVQVYGTADAGVTGFYKESGGIYFVNADPTVVVKYSTSSTYVPVPSAFGFTVGSNLNGSGTTYYYRAWA